MSTNKSKLQQTVDSLIELSKRTIAENKKKKLEETLRSLHLENKLECEQTDVQKFFGNDSDSDEFDFEYASKDSVELPKLDSINSIEIRVIINGVSTTIFNYIA